ncbi:MAG: DUF4153 domain-containing protein [Gemmobacter sp.]|uniref:DUF4153 domain-containing protein n=1 Tax=Gemmobacter sp. TaxID=1898957 RepID=UPI001A44DDD7|nr:DUF4153 domain-containing protein [Gemmobacter sp.]MBL8561828.1 DUF4153 domain-containing protein [Gemmobacter sp.]
MTPHSAPARPHLPLALLGAAGGLAFHVLSEALAQDWLPERLALALAAFALVFFTATLGMAGPLSLRRAMLAAAPLALAVSGLLVLASLRFDSAADLFHSGIPVLSALTLTLLPLPFLIAQARGDWRHYPTLFAEAWGSVIRQAAGWLFVGVALLTLSLSQELFDLVGLNWLRRLTDLELFFPLFIGAMLGLGIAATQDMPGLVAPDLVIRLMRLMAPVLLGVLLIFLIALPLRGFETLFRTLSAASVLLSLAVMITALVTAAVERSASEATHSPLITQAARALAALLPLPTGLALWAIWQRVAQYGWTPDRLLAFCIALLALGYGLLYLHAVLRGAAWQVWQRRANLVMALVAIGLSALLLTPVLNPERIATASQMARLEAGQIDTARLDVPALAEWGRPGAEALASLRQRRDDPALQAALARLEDAAAPARAAPRREGLAAMLPLRPAEAAPLRDAVLEALDAIEVTELRDACGIVINGLSDCAMVAADLIPDQPGPEVILARRDEANRILLSAFSVVEGRVIRLDFQQFGPAAFSQQEADAVMRDLQEGAAILAPAQLQTLSAGRLKLLLLPTQEGNR